MTKKTLSWVLVISFVLLPHFSSAVEESNHSYKICGRSYSDQSPFAWKDIQLRYTSQLDAGDFDAVKRALLDELRISPQQKEAGPREIFLAKGKEVVDSTAPCCSQFALRSLEDEDFNSHLSLFSGKILMDDCGPNNEKGVQLDELRYIADDFEQLGRMYISTFQSTAVMVIRKKNEEYDRMLFHGFPMFPWEALANSGLLTNSDISKGPPINQIVLFHPSAGAEVQVGLRESKLAASLALEPIGWVHYPKAQEHRSWWGVSTLTTFRNDMGIGIGAAVRYENFMAGILWHDSDNDRRLFNSKPFIFLGLDLYQFAGEQLRRYDGLRDRVTDILKKDAAQSPTQ